MEPNVFARVVVIIWFVSKRKIDALIAQLTFIMLITSHPHKSILGENSKNITNVSFLFTPAHLLIKTKKILPYAAKCVPFCFANLWLDFFWPWYMGIIENPMVDPSLNLKYFDFEFKIWPEAWWSLMKREMVWQGRNSKNLKSPFCSKKSPN